GCVGELLLHLCGARQLGLADGDDLRALNEAMAILLQFAADRAVVFDRIGTVGRLRFDEVDQHACAFDVTQEFVPQASAGVRTFDEAGNVCHDERAIHVDRYDAEVRDLRGERVVGDFGPCARHTAEQRTLAGVWFAYETDVGDDFQLEREAARFALFAASEFARGLVGGRLEADVTFAAFAAVGSNHLIAG